MGDTTKVQELHPNDSTLIEAVTKVLGTAFIEDPLVRYTFEGSPRPELVARLWAPTVKAGASYGKVFVAMPGIRGAAVAMPPDHVELTESEQEAVGFANLERSLGEEVFHRFNVYVSRMQDLHKRSLSGAHWYIPLVGVSAACRNQGLATALLQPILAEADADQLPIYLETATERNLSLYGRFGFHVLAHGVDDVSAVPYWTMQREPRTRNLAAAPEGNWER